MSPRGYRVLGGGSSTPPTVAVGPDFGERGTADGVTNEMGVQVRMPTLALVAADEEIGVQVRNPSNHLRLGTPQGIGLHTAASALGAPFWQSVATTTLPASTTTTDTNIVATHPSGLAVGDFMLAFVGGNGVVNAPGIAPPAGWTGLSPAAPVFLTLSATGFWKVATASDVSAGSTTFVLSAVGGMKTATGEIHRIIAVDSTTPINVDAAGNWAAASGADPVVVAVTTTVINCLVFEYVLHDHAALSQTHTPPAGHAERTDFQSNLSATFIGSWSATRVFAAAADTGTATCNCTETVATNAVFYRVAVAPGTLTLAV